jgi:copper chaperone CopZ
MAQQGSHKAGEAVLTISGMTCGGCANTVGRILSRVPGVDAAAVDFETRQATVTGEVSTVDLIAAVEAAGYGAKDANPTQGGANGAD